MANKPDEDIVQAAGSLRDALATANREAKVLRDLGADVEFDFDLSGDLEQLEVKILVQHIRTY